MLRGRFAGMLVIESPHLVERVEVIVLRRWRERLWSWPWRPWLRTKIVVREVPSKEAIVDRERGIIYCHPQFASALRDAVPKGAG